MPALGIGRIVHYRLSDKDTKNIRAARLLPNRGGNNPYEGYIVPLVIVAIWPHEYGKGIPGVNGQAILDGNDTLWVTSVKEGTEPGTWSWPEIK